MLINVSVDRVLWLAMRSVPRGKPIAAVEGVLCSE